MRCDVVGNTGPPPAGIACSHCAVVAYGVNVDSQLGEHAILQDVVGEQAVDGLDLPGRVHRDLVACFRIGSRGDRRNAGRGTRAPSYNNSQGSSPLPGVRRSSAADAGSAGFASAASAAFASACRTSIGSRSWNIVLNGSRKPTPSGWTGCGGVAPTFSISGLRWRLDVTLHLRLRVQDERACAVVSRQSHRRRDRSAAARPARSGGRTMICSSGVMTAPFAAAVVQVRVSALKSLALKTRLAELGVETDRQRQRGAERRRNRWAGSACRCRARASACRPRARHTRRRRRGRSRPSWTDRRRGIPVYNALDHELEDTRLDLSRRRRRSSRYREPLLLILNLRLVSGNARRNTLCSKTREDRLAAVIRAEVASANSRRHDWRRPPAGHGFTAASTTAVRARPPARWAQTPLWRPKQSERESLEKDLWAAHRRTARGDLVAPRPTTQVALGRRH